MSSLHKDLADVMGIVGYIQKDGKNDFHKYKYASAASVMGKVNAELSKRGICVSSECKTIHYEVGHAVVHVRLTLTRDDEKVAIEGIGEGSDKGDKAIMKAMTAASKYALATGFIISWGDDPESDKTTDTAADEVTKLVALFLAAKDKDTLTKLVRDVQYLLNQKRITPGQSKKLAQKYNEALARLS